MTATRVLIVDDDSRVRSMLTEYLESQGMQVTGAQDGGEMWACLEKAPADVILLDLVLPGDDGLTLAGQLRSRVDAGIIILTGRGDVVDRVVGLEMGADDYVSKPFHLREVLARIKSVLRRARPVVAAAPAAVPAPKADTIGFDGWTVHPQRREVTNPDGQEVTLTTGEYELLLAFLQSPNQVLSRDQLMDLVKGRHWEAYDRTVDTQVVRLRRKIEADPKNPKLIKAVRGAGYIFVSVVERH